MANTQNGIDISNHQASMNLGTVLDKTKTDFVICKATEGTSLLINTVMDLFRLLRNTASSLAFMTLPVQRKIKRSMKLSFS